MPLEDVRCADEQKPGPAVVGMIEVGGSALSTGGNQRRTSGGGILIIGFCSLSASSEAAEAWLWLFFGDDAFLFWALSLQEQPLACNIQIYHCPYLLVQHLQDLQVLMVQNILVVKYQPLRLAQRHETSATSELSADRNPLRW